MPDLLHFTPKINNKHITEASRFNPVTKLFESSGLSHNPEKKVLVFHEVDKPWGTGRKFNEKVKNLIEEGFQVVLRGHNGVYHLHDLSTRKTDITTVPEKKLGRIIIPEKETDSLDQHFSDITGNGNNFNSKTTKYDTSDYDNLTRQHGLSRDQMLIVSQLSPQEKYQAFPDLYDQSRTAEKKEKNPQENVKSDHINMVRDSKEIAAEINEIVGPYGRYDVCSTEDNLLKDSVLSSGPKTQKILIKTHYTSQEAMDENANLLIGAATKANKPVFYLDSFEQTLPSQTRDENNTESPLISFLKKHEKSANKPVLIINWDNFDPKQRLSLNTLIDKESRIGDVKINDSVKIVSLTQRDNDPSFALRHDQAILSNIKPQTSVEVLQRDALNPETVKNSWGNDIKGSNSNSLVQIHDQSDESMLKHAELLGKAAKNNESPIFYLEKMEDLGTYDGKGKYYTERDEKSKLSEFLKEKENKNPVVIINRDKFDDSQYDYIGSLINKKRKFDDSFSNPSNKNDIKVISLTQNFDKSIASRYQKTFTANLKPETIDSYLNSNLENTAEAQNIDVKGLSDWRSQIFGRESQQGDNVVWQQSDFAKELDAKKDNTNYQVNFEISNMPPEAKEEFQREVARAKALGKFIYNNHEIPISQNAQITVSDAAFDFTKFNREDQVKVSTEATLNGENDRHIINPQLFGLLLHGKELVEGTKYKETDGLISACKEEHKTLKLFITSDLSENQWYCLLAKAKEEGVSLDLNLAKGVQLPEGVSSEKSVYLESESTKADLKPKIIVSDDATETVKVLNSGLSGADKYHAIIDVEDLTCQDLAGSIHYNKETKEFNKVKGLLERDEKIILKGSFSPELLQMLEPSLVKAGGNITVIIEGREKEEGKEYNPLPWIEESLLETPQKYNTSRPELKDPIKEPDSAEGLEKSVDKSKEFLDARKKHFDDNFVGSQMLQLVSHSGFGKSSLIKILEAEKIKGASANSETGEAEKANAVYRELVNLKEWANDKSDKTKYLFIDESNIENSHLTLFSPLKKGGNNRIFDPVSGEFFDLTEKHKVVFACNPKGYGGGRTDQKLFEDNTIPSIELHNFPDSYVYEEILKKAIYDGLSPAEKAILSDVNFSKICIPAIKEYQKTSLDKTIEDMYAVLKEKDEDIPEIPEAFITGLKKHITEPEYPNREDMQVTAIKIFLREYAGETGKITNQFNRPDLETDVGTKCMSIFSSYKLAENLGTGITRQETVRELQQRVLIKTNEELSKEKQGKIETEGFISTTATENVELELSQALDIKARQRSSTAKNSDDLNRAIGLNGILLEGDSGTGKSELINAMLVSKNIVDGDDEKNKGSEKQKFYKIDASLPRDEKKAIITKAYEEGNIVWIDEINSCIDDGLEKDLNLALTGDHPSGKKADKDTAVKPGFMMISSVNSISLEGRSEISPALRHRTTQVKVKSAREYSVEDMTTIAEHWIKNDQENIVTELEKTLNKAKPGTEDFKKTFLWGNAEMVIGDKLAVQHKNLGIDELTKLYKAQYNANLTELTDWNKIDQAYALKNWADSCINDKENKDEMMQLLVKTTLKSAEYVTQVNALATQELKERQNNFSDSHKKNALDPDFIKPLSVEVGKKMLQNAQADLNTSGFRLFKNKLPEIASCYYCLYDTNDRSEAKKSTAPVVPTKAATGFDTQVNDTASAETDEKGQVTINSTEATPSVNVNEDNDVATPVLVTIPAGVGVPHSVDVTQETADLYKELDGYHSPVKEVPVKEHEVDPLMAEIEELCSPENDGSESTSAGEAYLGEDKKENIYQQVDKAGKNVNEPITAKEAADKKLEFLDDFKLTNKKGEDSAVIIERTKNSLRDITAKGIETTAKRDLESKREDVGEFSNTNYERHTRKDFTNTDLSAAFMNSFANCTFSGDCAFTKISENNNRFVNCTFGKGCNEAQAKEQAEELIKIDPKLLINCTFTKEFLNELSPDLKTKFDKHFNIQENKTPSSEIKPLSSFKLAEATVKSASLE